MMAPFGALGDGEIGASAGKITGGVGEALLATAAGLVIAIIGLFPYNILSARIESAKHDISDPSNALEVIIKKAASCDACPPPPRPTPLLPRRKRRPRRRGRRTHRTCMRPRTPPSSCRPRRRRRHCPCRLRVRSCSMGLRPRRRGSCRRPQQRAARSRRK